MSLKPFIHRFSPSINHPSSPTNQPSTSAGKLSSLKFWKKSPPPPDPFPPVASPDTLTPACKFALKTSLTKKGKLSAEVKSHSAAIEPLLKKTICNENMSYQDAIQRPDGSQHVLLDKQGRLVSLLSGEAGFIGIRNSQQKTSWSAERAKSFPSGGQALIPALEWSGERDVLVKGERVSLPNQALVDYLTDSASDTSGRHRSHLKKHYQFDEASNEWRLKTTGPEKITILKTEPSGQAWCVTDDKTLSPLSPLPTSLSDLSHLTRKIQHIGTDTPSEPDSIRPELKFSHKVEHYSVSPQNQAFVQLNNEDDKIQRLVWFEDVRRPDERLNVSLPDGYSCRKTAIFDHTLFAIDYRGALQCCPLPSERHPRLAFDAEVHNVRARTINDLLVKTLGKNVRIEDFGRIAEDRLNLIVRDASDQRHFVCVKMNSTRPIIEGAWNLSDSLTLDHQQGMTPLAPEPQNVMDLGPLGKVTLYDNRPYFLNENTGQWELSHEEHIMRFKLSKLRCGLDGKPWMLKDGQIKRLKIRLASSKVAQDNVVFALPQKKKSLSIEFSLSGLENVHNLVDFAAADARNVVALNSDGDLHFLTSGSNRIISHSDLNLSVKSLALNSDKSLWMATENGALYSLPETSWTQGKMTGLKPVQIPPDENGKPLNVAALHTVGPGGIMIEDTSGNIWAQDGQRWNKVKGGVPEEKSEHNPADETYHRLHGEEHAWRIPGTGMTMKTHFHLGGQETQKQKSMKTGFKKRFDAFIFRPTLEWPRPLKNVGYGVQHSYAGREGLQPVYQAQSELAKSIRLFESETHSPLTTRLYALRGDAITTEEKKLLSDVADLGELLSASAHHFAQITAQHYGLLDKEFRVITNPKHRHAKSGRFNPASTRASDLTANLFKVFSGNGMDEANRSREVMAMLVAGNVVLNQQKEQIPGGRQRDIHDEIGLIKSRLTLDALISAQLHQLVSEIKIALNAKGRHEDVIELLSDRLAQLRYERWEGNPVKLATDQGFAGHETLEANYDTIRTMIKAFSKDNHGVNITARSVLQAVDQAALARNLTETLMAMEPGESLSVTRNYGLNAQVTSYFSKALFISAGARGALNRSYQMAVSRNDHGFSVSFGRIGSASGNLMVGLSDNIAHEFDLTHKVFLDEEHHMPMSKTLLVGGSISLAGREMNQNRLVLNIEEHELNRFIDQLVNGELNPLEVMGRGNSHLLQKTTIQDFALSAGVGAHAYLSLPFVSDEVENVTAIGRFRATAVAGVDVLSGHRERASLFMVNGQGVHKSDNHLNVADRAFAGAQLVAPFGPRIMSEGGINNATAYINPSVDVHVSVDNRTTHNLKIAFTDAEKITTNDIDHIIGKLEKYFTDNDSAQLMVKLQKKHPGGDNLSPEEKLAALDRHFSQWYHPENIEDPLQFPDAGSRHAELNGHGPKSELLNLQALVRQQAAFTQQAQLITQAEYQTIYKNMARLDHNSFCHTLAHLADGTSTGSNADRLKEMMKNDHQLSGFMHTLQDNAHAVASVTLELNTSARTRLEKEWAKKSVTQEVISEVLKDRSNLRLKSVRFNQSVKKMDGFSSPSFVIGGSNGAAIAMTEHLGTIQFSYADDDEKNPASYTLKGRIAQNDNDVSQAIMFARKAGFVLRTTG